MHLNKKHKTLYVSLISLRLQYENQGLLEPGATDNALSEAKLRQVSHAHPEAFSSELHPPTYKVELLNGNLQLENKYQLENKCFSGSLLQEKYLRKLF